MGARDERHAAQQQREIGEASLPRALEDLPAKWTGPGWWLVHHDARYALPRLPDASVDLVFADPPYRLSNGGSTCRSGQRAPVDKGEWDGTMGSTWDHAFNHEWLVECRRLLKPTGAIWVTGTHHVIFSIGWGMQQLGFHTLNLVTWFKPNAAPNLGCRQLTHSTEFAVWAARDHRDPPLYRFNYDELRRANNGRQLRDLWTFSPPSVLERGDGLLAGQEPHPTQKPLALLERIIATSTTPGDLVLDPFCGSGTTGVAALAAGCRFVGVDLDATWLEVTARRLGRTP